MKIYIAGKVTGLPENQVKPKFDHAKRWLISLGYTPINPLELVALDTDWNIAMKICIDALSKADGIYLLPDWMDSMGARQEVQYAITYEKQIFNEHTIKLNRN